MKTEEDSSNNNVFLYSIIAEELLISSIMINNAVLPEIAEIVLQEDFSNSARKKIFKVVVELYLKNIPVNLETLTNALKKKGQLDEIGGKTYLEKLKDKAKTALHAKIYARQIRDKAFLRTLIKKASELEKTNEMSKSAYEDDYHVDSLMEFVDRSISELSISRLSKTPYLPLSNVIENSIDSIEEFEYKGSKFKDVLSGFGSIDRLTGGFHNTDLIIIAARPLMGKTSLALSIAQYAAGNAGVPVLFF